MIKKLLISCALVLLLGGCEVNDKNKEQESTSVEQEAVVLNDRQKDILIEMGLPTTYEDLGKPQQESIVAIEELLTYLEDRYDTSFSYVAYYPLEAIQDEKLTALPDWGDPEVDLVTVERPRDGSAIKDDYPSVAARPIYQVELDKAVDEIASPGAVKAYVTDSVYEVDEVPTDFESLLSNGFSASQNVFVKESAATDLDEVSQGLQAWLEEKEIPGGSRLFLLSDEDFDQVTQDNFPDFQTNGHPLDKAEIIIKR